MIALVLGPIIASIIKPSLGLTPDQTAEVVRTLCEAGVDFIKDDEKMMSPAYSPFEARVDAGRDLAELLARAGVDQFCVGGLATDYCVRATVLSALSRGLGVSLLTDAVAGVNVQPGDAQRAVREMVAAGAQLTTTDQVTVNGPDQGQGGRG